MMTSAPRGSIPSKAASHRRNNTHLKKKRTVPVPEDVKNPLKKLWSLVRPVIGAVAGPATFAFAYAAARDGAPFPIPQNFSRGDVIAALIIAAIGYGATKHLTTGVLKPVMAIAAFGALCGAWAAGIDNSEDRIEMIGKCMDDGHSNDFCMGYKRLAPR